MEKPTIRINENMHAVLTAAIGCYLAYIAYQLFSQPGDMAPALAIGISVFFALAALTVLGYAVHIWKKARQQKADASAEEPRDESSQGISKD